MWLSWITSSACRQRTNAAARASLTELLPRFCDVNLPVPLDQPFTYSVPLSLEHQVKAGARILVPFGPRKLTGLILRAHDETPEISVERSAPADRFRARHW